jgi:hypothetical protein
MRIGFLVSVVALLVGCARHTSVMTLGIASEPRAADFAACPFGHAALRDVPVLNGLLLWTPELRRAADDPEFWPGGCSGNSSNKVVCANCRYAYDASARLWVRSSESRDGFLRPQASWAADFPIAALPASKAMYSQSVDGTGDVRCEEVVYWSGEASRNIEEQIVARMPGMGRPASRETRVYLDREYVELHWHAQPLALDVELMYCGDVGQTCVHARSSR